MYTHDIRTIWKVIVINVLIVISWTFLVTPHSFRVLITIERGLAVNAFSQYSSCNCICRGAAGDLACDQLKVQSQLKR